METMDPSEIMSNCERAKRVITTRIKEILPTIPELERQYKIAADIYGKQPKIAVRDMLTQLENGSLVESDVTLQWSKARDTLTLANMKMDAFKYVLTLIDREMIDIIPELPPVERARRRCHNYVVPSLREDDPLNAELSAIPFKVKSDICYAFLEDATKYTNDITELEETIDRDHMLVDSGRMSKEYADQDIKRLNSECDRLAEEIKQKHLALRSYIVREAKRRAHTHE